ncbi:flagellin N-terminal helical domain-containing protein [Ferroacidibacillus organovorans]|uniref:Flagellin n=1 Tax=Ferroacidibacillus organovorans TaxID=1765683 RepID=A0A162UFR0_9BACL|nr:flagellin [Ferroacidibacillus organovorans]KYP81718.1 hypothetical protein AYJ22_06255 [Ferroacidibacillus organovorans]OAG94258.1 hypothetical protein AYW79_06480 [Ferroacidibacillus organovorans]OPG16907.1 hypothetical protein B2M26_04085 [Ferroacidibacillus organovorans]
MRVTESMMQSQFLYNLTQANANMQTLQLELSTGKTLNQPSDNPLAVSQDMAIRASLSETTAYSGTIAAGQMWLSNSSNTLQTMMTTLQSLQSTVLEGLNAPTASSSARQALANVAQSDVSNLGQLLNTKVENRYLFGGFADQVQPSSYALSTGTSPSGASGSIQYTVANGIQVSINVTATSIMQSTPSGATQDLQTTLSNIASDLASGTNAALQSDLSNLQANISQVSDLNASVGARQDRLTALQNQLSTYAQTLSTDKGVIQDANMAQVITQFNTDQTVYQAALKMGASILLPSLVTYLPNG